MRGRRSSRARRVEIGSVLGARYELRALLGEGGGGSTYAARDRLREEDVALKVVRDDGHGDETREALRVELRALGGLEHRGLVRVRALGADTGDDGRVLDYLVTELVRGTTLERFAAGRPFARSIEPLCDALEGLHYLNRLGLVHGDVKPENVVVASDGACGVLIDLGCARTIGSVTATAAGTKGYVAPEVLEGRAPDARADVFAVGRTLARIAEIAVPGSVPSAIVELARAASARDRADRPTDVAEVLARLGRTGDLALPPRGKASRMLGRETEMRGGIEAIDGLVEGRGGPRVVWIEGPDGIGKTRLATELRWAAELRTRVVEGDACRADAIAWTLGAALGRGPIDGGLDAILDARGAIASRSSSVVIVIDDADRLDAHGAIELASVMRLAAPGDRLLWVLAGTRAPDEVRASPVARVISLEGLDDRALSQWAGNALSTRRVGALREASDGVPARVEALLAALAHEPEGIVLAEGARPADDARLRGIASASRVDRACLVAISLAYETRAPSLVERLRADAPTIARLVERGWVRTSEGTHRLHSLHLEEVVAGADPRDVEALVKELEHGSRDVGDDVSSATASVPGAPATASVAVEAAIVRTLAAMGARDRAIARFVGARGRFDRAPSTWATVLPALGALGPEAAIVAAEVELAAGRPRDALHRIARVVRWAPDRATRDRARALGASAYLRAGRAGRALAAIDRTETATGGSRGVAAADPEAGVARSDVRARALLALGRYAEADREATAALSHAESEARRASLSETIGLAASYRGEHARARDELGRARGAWSRLVDPRAVVRVLSYEGIAASREGDVARAASKHDEALAVAEREGLDDQLASVLLNAGTAHAQEGEWGRALAAFERGTRLARALGKESTEAWLAWNAANVLASIGLVDRAEHVLGSMARGVATPALDAATLALRAEIAMVRGAWSDARSTLDRAVVAHEALGARRETLERRLDRVGLELRDSASTFDVVRALDDVARAVAELGGASDLAVREATLRGRAACRDGDAARAIATLDRARVAASELRSTGLVAEIDGALAEAWAAAGDEEVASGHRARARERWSRVALGLPLEMRDVFWRHPVRASIGAARLAVERAAGSGGSAAARRPSGPSFEGSTGNAGGSPRPTESPPPSIARILEINRKLASSLVPSDVLAHALDAAIELTGAERGFVLVTKEDATDDRASSALEVAVARNLDRERVGRSHSKFSHGIAASVVRRGEPVVTTDARADERFRANASVHAMKLTSVACVPIRGEGGTLGAIYLDNRFERGRFGPGDLETLAVFADQVAIALRNARLHAALETRTRELEIEKKRIESLAAAQAKELAWLSDERRAKDDASSADSTRHAYAEIVGRSAPMRRLRAMLDRVVDSPLPVLVSGESGTGKELVARALHVHGPRRDRPFVGINCAALPESLLESELFGYVRGAFTGADRDRPGLFVAARGGTLFLDEIGETSLAMQAKLLRVLQEREVRPLGSSRSVRTDVRLVAATNRRLRDEIAAGRFREDLYYRIAVVELTVPPLRDRLDDLPALVRALLDRLARDSRRAAPIVGADALRLLARHPWPGNVRELENVLGRALTMTDATEITPRDLDLSPASASSPSRPASRTAHERDEADRILAALRDTSFRVSEVARRLGIPRNTLYRRMRRYGIQLRD